MLKKLLIVCCFYPLYVQAQIKVKGGTGLLIESGTNMTLHSSSTDTFAVDSMASVINNGSILMDAGTQISEQPGFPISGSGVETLTKNFALTSSPQSINGTGLWLKGNSSDMIHIERWHQPMTNQAGDASVNRIFKISPAGSTFYQAGIFYDLTELNGLDPLNMMLFSSADSVNWMNEGGNDSSYFVRYTDSLQGSQLVTAYNARIVPPTMNDSVFCVNDSLTIQLATEGLFNSNSFFILEADHDPLFSSPLTIDTVYETGGDLGYIPATGLSDGDTLYIRIRTENPNTGYIDLGSIAVYSYPVVSITGLDAHYCLNGAPDPVNLLPAGGILSGAGWNGTGFDPQAAGVGQQIWTYTFINNGGCTSATSDTTNVTAPPVANLLSPQTIFCANDPAVELNGSPANGVYTGAGLTDSIFNPAASGIGNFTILYTITDSLGCTGSDSLDMLVEALPATPTISRISDTLSCSVVADHYQWYLDGNPIAGSDAPSIVVSTDGLYTVEVINAAGCTAISSSYNYIETAISPLNQSDFIVYPNPVISGNTLYLQSQYKNLSYSLIAANGQEIMNGKVENGQLETGRLTQGIYILQLRTATGLLFRHKILVTDK